ncbi:hypothetical protein FAI41_04280 [Acetobacteraceae bacterium]|nr:hypothetical protein FAI41_04280 [Acetobacteraceae bacterium]
MLISAFFFLFSLAYKERHAFLRFLSYRTEQARRKIDQGGRQATLIAGREYCCQCSYLEAFLKTYQPEIMATLIYVLQMSGIALEDYFEALEIKEDWPKFQQLMGEVSLMVMEKARIPEGKGKELAIFEVQERYIPKLITALEAFKATFD